MIGFLFVTGSCQERGLVFPLIMSEINLNLN